MRASVVSILLAVGCTPHAASPHGTAPARAATVVTVQPLEGGAAPHTGAVSSDAGAPLRTFDAGPSPERAGEFDQRMEGGVSFAAKLHLRAADGGLSFHGSFTTEAGAPLSKLSPELVVRSALLVPVPSSGKPELTLFERRVDCATRWSHQGRQLSMSIDWKHGTSSIFVDVNITNGHFERYKGHLEVLSAPTAPGSTGTIRLDPTPAGNVRGGRVRVHICR